MLLLIVTVIPSLVLGKLQELRGEECDDGYIDCGARAELCFSSHIPSVLNMLTHCRQTCRHSFTDRNHTEVVSLLGGLEDKVQDVLGGEMPVCSAAQGVDSTLRFSLLRHRLASVLQPAWVPAFTSEGIKVMEVPSRLMGMINMARITGIKMMEEEACYAEVACFNCQKLVEDKKECKLPQHSGRQMIIPISQQLKDTILETLHPIAEDWARVRLLGTSVYGIRRYKAGSWLATHLDRIDSHVISVIINVAQTGAWPLIIADHEGEVHRVSLSPGEMLLYESAKLPHGRPETFTGEYFDNIFVHFKPQSKAWWRSGGVRWDEGDTPAWGLTIQGEGERRRIVRTK